VKLNIYCTDINFGVYFIVALRKSGLHQFQAVILEDFSSVPTVISPLRPRGNFMYLKFYTYLLTPWSRVLLEKLTGSASSFAAFLEPEGSSPY
jgi:hypothetical protein